MACEVCEHCQSPVSGEERVTGREGFSYHKKCHKCYVCSETDLQNAEVFKGVIFCSSCAQRIFQGCSTARKTKTAHISRAKRPRSRSHRRERTKTQERKTNRSRDGVIELAARAVSTTDSEDHRTSKKPIRTSKPVIPSKQALQATKESQPEKCYYIQPMKELKKDSTEMGTTTDVTQELLRQIDCPIPDCRAKECVPPESLFQPRRHPKRQKKKKDIIDSHKKPTCSDLRMAELGVSTEIANMTLRKKSEVPVIIKSDTRMKNRKSDSLSVLHQESDHSGDTGTDWVDSAYSTIDESEKTRMMDRRLGSILKLPLKFFKKNILNRSSLISVMISADKEKDIGLMRRLKRLMHEETIEHQDRDRWKEMGETFAQQWDTAERGMKRLYSTINRRRTPYKLGWINLVSKVSNIIPEQSFCTCKKRCKHFEESHSYRCMRAQVMKLAGPTKSELACFRQKLKKFVAPQLLRNVLYSKTEYPAIKMSQACGCDKRSV